MFIASRNAGLLRACTFGVTTLRRGRGFRKRRPWGALAICLGSGRRDAAVLSNNRHVFPLWEGLSGGGKNRRTGVQGSRQENGREPVA